MNIYLVSTNDRVGYDEYDAVVVFSETEEDAIATAKECCFNFGGNLTVLNVGVANNGIDVGVLLASFNAG